MTAFPNVSMFRPRSGRVSGFQQAAANRSNDQQSMRFDDEEARRFLQRSGLQERSLRRRILEAREAGDLDSMESLQSQLQEMVGLRRDTAQAVSPRDTTADDLRAGRQGLIDQFPDAARGAAETMRAHAGGVAGQLDAEERRIGVGRLRALGLNPDDVPESRAERLGELSNEREAINYGDGFDRRARFRDLRQRFLSEADELDGRAERGLVLNEDFDADALAARIAREDDASLRRALEAQRRRSVLTDNERADFDAADTVVDAGRDATVADARSQANLARAAEAAGERNLTMSESRRDSAAEEARAQARRRIADADAEAALAEGRADQVPDELAVRDAELAARKLQLEGAISEMNGQRVVTDWDKMNETAAVGAQTIAAAFDPNEVGRTTFDKVPVGAIDTLDQVVTPLVQQAASSQSATDRRAAANAARSVLAQLPSVGTSGQYEVTTTIWGDITDAATGVMNSGTSTSALLRGRQRLRAQQAVDRLNEMRRVLMEIANADQTG